jgi:hypothetical protein
LAFGDLVLLLESTRDVNLLVTFYQRRSYRHHTEGLYKEIAMQEEVFAEAFTGASVILPVMTETESLVQTFDIVESHCANDVCEYILVVCERTSKESLTVCEKLVARDPERVQMLYQKLPFLGGAIREAFDQAKSSHVIMMASDLETDPNDVRTMIQEAKAAPNAIITASRWIQGGGFQGYNLAKLVSNMLFQRLFSLLYRCRLSDMTYGYRLFPTKLVQAIVWEELRHPFLLETILKPLRLGVKVKETSTVWRARREGESQNPFFRNFQYFPVGLRVLRYRRSDILKPIKP